MKKRLRTIDNAVGFKEIEKEIKIFMKRNNFSHNEIQSIFHLMNSYYFMGLDLENVEG